MRLALVSDIHGNLAALQAVAADIRLRGADAVLNLGDSLSGPLLPRETAQFLMHSGWLSIAGNHERQLLACPHCATGSSDQYAFSQLKPPELEWVRCLPVQHRYNSDLFLCHGTPRSDLIYLTETVEHGHMVLSHVKDIAERLKSETSPMVACGHSHIPRSVRQPNGQHIVNPGSVGLQAYTDDHPHPHVMETGSPDARYAIIEHKAGVWSIQLHSVPYDYGAMAQLARMRGRIDWETALLYGRAH